MITELVAERRNAFAWVVMYQHDEARFQIVSRWIRPDACVSPKRGIYGLKVRVSRMFVDRPKADAHLAFTQKCATFALRSPL